MINNYVSSKITYLLRIALANLSCNCACVYPNKYRSEFYIYVGTIIQTVMSQYILILILINRLT